MWYHYANGLRGFCIEFAFNILIDQCIKIDPLVFNGFIIYREKIPTIDMSFVLSLVKANTENRKLFWDVIGKRYMHKAIEWEYENEYRIIGMFDKPLKYTKECILSIIIGERMPVSEREGLEHICKEKGYKLKLAKKTDELYRVDIQDYKN